MKKTNTTKKLVLNRVVVRQLQQNLTEAELKAVVGGAGVAESPSMTIGDDEGDIC